MNEAQTELESALATARHALEQFKADPLVSSKRGGPRISPWFRAWVQASEIAQRWHRQLHQSQPEVRWVDAEFDELLRDPGQGCSSRDDTGEGREVRRIVSPNHRRREAQP
jgi:hypothetical protein